MLIFPHAPNQITQQAVPGDTSWRIVASDGTTYTSTALMLAAGRVPFPSLDPGMFLQTITLRSVNAGADGSPFYYAKNPNPTPPTGTNGQLVSGSGQQMVAAGNVWTVWVKLTAATDTIELLGQY